MKREFWLEKWERGEIGFHQDEINPYLLQCWKELGVAHSATVFVPLCGKSRDMLWLRDQGHAVVGVELSEIAVQTLFEENGLSPRRSTVGRFNRYDADGICILHGDFFDLTRDSLAKVGAVYDRASLIALPPEMRAGYARHLINILPAATQILLITYDYAQREMQGPPFAVSPREVETLYREHAEIRLLAQENALEYNQRLRERGLSKLDENIFLLKLRQLA